MPSLHIVHCTQFGRINTLYLISSCFVDEALEPSFVSSLANLNS
jgi:hypothetical protein